MTECRCDGTITDVPTSHYEAKTARLKELTTFLARFAPSVGERAGYEPEIELSADMTEARDRAISAAFDAVASLSFQSYQVRPETN